VVVGVGVVVVVGVVTLAAIVGRRWRYCSIIISNSRMAQKINMNTLQLRSVDLLEILIKKPRPVNKVYLKLSACSILCMHMFCVCRRVYVGKPRTQKPFYLLN
jgi:hypothetical protein